MLGMTVEKHSAFTPTFPYFRHKNYPMRLSVITVFALALWSCQPEENQRHRQIEKLESQLEQSADEPKADELVNAYLSYVDTHPSDTAWNNRYLYRAAGIKYRQRDFGSAINYINRALENYFSDANTPRHAILLAAIYRDELRNPVLSNTVYQAAQRAFPNFEDDQLQLQRDLPPLEDRLDTLRRAVFPDATAGPNIQAANNYITATEIYGRLLPQAEATPQILFEGAEMARSMGLYRQAAGMYSKVAQQYSMTKPARLALFMQAFTLDNELKDYDSARVCYERFLEKYPNDDFADDAQVLLRNLGRSPEEMIQELEQ